MPAVEVGNNDIIIFLLLYVSVFVGGGIYALALLLAKLLKIFPILAFPTFCHSIKIFSLMIAVAVVAAIMLLTEFSNIRNATPTSAGLSYGSASISAAIQSKLNFNFPAHFISILVLLTAFVA